MTDFVKTLELKIQQLQDAKTDHLEAIADIDTKVALLEELLVGEGGGPIAPSPPKSPKKRRPGRPKGAKNKKTASQDGRVPEEQLQEADAMGGTDPEVAKRLVGRFRSTRRIPESKGPGVRAGRPEDVERGLSTVTGVGKRQLTTQQPEEEVDYGRVQGE